jgi:hypothetical protein
MMTDGSIREVDDGYLLFGGNMCRLAGRMNELARGGKGLE